MATIVKAPNYPASLVENKPSIFLAGSIEMGAAEDWQNRLTSALNEMDVVIFNPRRGDWDSSWEQKIENEQFREQVEWELARLQESDVIALYLDPSTKSPISLLELGLFARSKRLVVYCPEGFWRKGNVDITCAWFGVSRVDSFDELINTVKNEILELQ